MIESKNTSIGCNAVAYCNNNAVNFADRDGHSLSAAVASAITTAIAIAIIIAVIAEVGISLTTSSVANNSDYSSAISQVRSFGNNYSLSKKSDYIFTICDN